MTESVTPVSREMPDVTRTEKVLFNFVRRPVLLANARLGRYDDEIIWLLGHARSGTTWLAELVNHDERLRDMFEPIRPQRVAPTGFLQCHQYARPGTDKPALHELMADIFSGRLTDARVDFANRRPLYSGLIVKDVFANLLAKWVIQEFPQVRPVLLIRNPFAACVSMLKRPRWYWPLDPADLLAQTDLVEDHLGEYRDVLARTAADGSELDKALATWAVVNLVPLRQFSESEMHVCFYEEWYEDPELRLAELLDFTSNTGAGADRLLSQEKIDKPSRMAKGGNVVENKSPVATWQRELTVDEIDRGTSLLDRLGVGDLYGDGIDPDRAALARLRTR